MKSETRKILTEFHTRYKALDVVGHKVEQAFQILVQCYEHGGKVLVCGNGGSAADAEHITGELMKGFLLQRPLPKCKLDQFIQQGDLEIGQKLQCGLPTISLNSQTALLTAVCNDNGEEMMYAQQVFGYGCDKDVLLALTTSGNSKNIIYAAKVAKVLGMQVIGFTGEASSQLCAIADVTLNVPAKETFKIQEYHLPIYHALCAMVENEIFSV